jgi:primosomal protein N' (replication factor Y)
LAAVIISAADEKTVEAAARDFAALAPATTTEIEIWGPSEPVFAIVRGRWRRRLLIRSSKTTNLSAYLKDWKERYKIKGSIRVKIDIDPYSFM